MIKITFLLKKNHTSTSLFIKAPQVENFNEGVRKTNGLKSVAIQHLQYFTIYLITETFCQSLLMCIAAKKDSKENISSDTPESMLTA